MRYIIRLAALVAVLFLTACGGGGGSAGSNPNTPVTPPPGPVVPPAPVAAGITILAAANTLPSASSSQLGFTVLVTDSSNNAIPNQTVTFSSSSGALIGALPAPLTGSNGALTSVVLTPGGNSSNRNITVTATSGSVQQSIVIPVVGTSLSLTGLGSVLAGATTTFTVIAQDSAGRGIVGAVLRVTSALGNSFSQTTLTTASNGEASFIYTANVGGNDTLQVSGLGTLAQSSLAISTQDFRYTFPSAGTTISVGSNQTLTTRFFAGGMPQVGQTVTFSTTRGSVSPVSVLTNAMGEASTLLSASTSGPATVLAQLASAQTSLPVSFVATTPASVVVQANPNSVLPNAAGATTNQITLLSTVRDAAGNPVPGRIVNFTALTDPSGGQIIPGSGTSDANGNVSVQFIPGATSSPSNGVVISAAVASTGVIGTTTLTVGGTALFITIGFGNTISNFDLQTYERMFTLFVTDANGTAAANRQITLSTLPETYLKGFLVFNSAVSLWVYAAPPTICPNEDINRNGSLNPGEDVNGNGLLTPGNPTVISAAGALGSSGIVTTDSNGLANFTLRYGENFAPWLTTRITARAQVGGTESATFIDYFTIGLSSDFSSQTNPPAGQESPFGTSTNCANPN